MESLMQSYQRSICWAKNSFSLNRYNSAISCVHPNVHLKIFNQFLTPHSLTEPFGRFIRRKNRIICVQQHRLRALESTMSSHTVPMITCFAFPLFYDFTSSLLRVRNINSANSWNARIQFCIAWRPIVFDKKKTNLSCFELRSFCMFGIIDCVWDFDESFAHLMIAFLNDAS